MSTLNFKDFTGKVIGDYNVLSFDKFQGGHTYWNIQCTNCGLKKSRSVQLFSRKCRCHKNEKRNLLIKDKIYNYLKAIHPVQSRKLGKKYYKFWLFKCKCGNIKEINLNSVTRGSVKSCGCLHKENIFKLPDKESSLRTLIYSYKENAKRRNLEYNLTRDEFVKLTSSNCFYCNEPPTKKFKRGKDQLQFNGNYVYNGIDRVNNSLGYISTNVVSCCETCNRAKLALSKDDFIFWVKKVYNNICLKHL